MSSSLVQRCARETEDWLRYHGRVRSLVGQYKLWRDRFQGRPGQQELARSIHRLCAAARMTDDPARLADIQSRIHDRLAQIDVRQVDWSALFAGYDVPRISKAAILKPWIGPREKGVVYISFENEWIKLLHCDLAEFASRYTLIVSPSSSPYNLVNYVFAHAYPEPFFSLISNPGDLAVFPHISPKLRGLPLYASCWVNPRRFQPVAKKDRAFDLIMVANFAKFKRHHALFGALREMPRTLRVLLIGQDQDGRTAETILSEARWYGVADRFVLRSNQTHAEVVQALCQSRASAVLSRREGACVVVAESMFADAPVALLQGAEIGSRVFLNEKTGVFLRDAHLAEDLTRFIHEADRFTPRDWAEKHISCFQSLQTLNAEVKQQALAEGQEWTRDLSPMEWRPDPSIIDPTDCREEQAERQQIRERFGINIGQEDS